MQHKASDRIGASPDSDRPRELLSPSEQSAGPSLLYRERGTHGSLGMIGAILGAAVATLIVLATSILVLNRLPWRLLAGSGASIAFESGARPPESLVRLVREGVVSPRDYYLVWQHKLQVVDPWDAEMGPHRAMTQHGQPQEQC